MGKPAPAFIMARTRLEDLSPPPLVLEAPSAPPPTEFRPPRPAERIKEALLRWLEEEM